MPTSDRVLPGKHAPVKVSPNHQTRRRWRVDGQVQGVGFRPFVYRLARRHRLCGFVRNDRTGVTIEAQGTRAQLAAFSRDLTAELPPLASLVQIRATRVETVGGTGFVILPSGIAGATGALVAADAATCDDCLAELLDPSDRRHRYGLINCTNCGPRYSIVRGVPYDRPNTTMASFVMCGACRSEYTDPADRRLHAQPIACHDCGPGVELVDGLGREMDGDPIERAADLIRYGRIVAIKGLGGFHLAARADLESAVVRLRGLKRRDTKPFAMMCGTTQQARRLVRLGSAAIEAMTSPATPIILASRYTDTSVAYNVAPQNHRLGVMLPSTPIHHLLFAAQAGSDAAPYVMTSGNLSGEPLVIGNHEAVERLGPVCDAILWHDRPIERVVDDSVLIDMGTNIPLPVRRARGYAPGALPLPVPANEPGLCLGGQLKSTIAVVRDGGAILSQHLGDLTHPLAFNYFKEAIDDLLHLFGTEPRWIGHDLHPAYLSTAHARMLAAERGIPLVGLQHHHAHAASVLAEHGCRGPVLAIVCDGVGYGDDGAAWGGELLLADLLDFRRMARLRPLVLPGGDASARDTRRCGLAMLHQALGHDFNRHPAARRLVNDSRDLEVLSAMIQRDVNTVLSSSAGRLFDGVAGLLGICMHNDHEARAATTLESAADAVGPVALPETSLFQIRGDGPIGGPQEIDLSPFVLHMIEQSDATPAASLAALFHEVLAAAWVEAAVVASQRTGISRVALTGGVFCNERLTSRLTDRLTRRGFDVIRHRLVPPNDGGLAYGQAAIVSARLAKPGPAANPGAPLRPSEYGGISSDPIHRGDLCV